LEEDCKGAALKVEIEDRSHAPLFRVFLSLQAAALRAVIHSNAAREVPRSQPGPEPYYFE
jgi:hypothetical protein